MGSTIPGMVRNSFCRVRNISRMVPTSFWMVDNVRGTLRNIENELATRFRMVPRQLVFVNWTLRMVPTIACMVESPWKIGTYLFWMLRTIRNELRTIHGRYVTILEMVETIQNWLECQQNRVATFQNCLATIRDEVGTIRNEVGTMQNELHTIRIELRTIRGMARTPLEGQQPLPRPWPGHKSTLATKKPCPPR